MRGTAKIGLQESHALLPSAAGFGGSRDLASSRFRGRPRRAVMGSLHWAATSGGLVICGSAVLPAHFGAAGSGSGPGRPRAGAVPNRGRLR